jgi:hypothetical protein
LADIPVPQGLTLRGGMMADNTLIYLARNSSGTGSFLLAGVPLSSQATFLEVSVPTGSPVAMGPITSQFLVVLETTPNFGQGCLELFNTGTLISTTGGTINPSSSCAPLSGSGNLVNGFLLPLSDGVGFLVGRVFSSGSGYTTEIDVYLQTSVISLAAGGSLPSPQPAWTLSTSYTTTAPISGAALSANTVILLPDPAANAVDLYQVSTIYYGGGGVLSPSYPPTRIATSALPHLLLVDPANNFLAVGAQDSASLFGLGSILNPPNGPLGSLGTINANTGEALGSLVIYTGSS